MISAVVLGENILTHEKRCKYINFVPCVFTYIKSIGLVQNNSEPKTVVELHCVNTPQYIELSISKQFENCCILINSGRRPYNFSLSIAKLLIPAVIGFEQLVYPIRNCNLIS